MSVIRTVKSKSSKVILLGLMAMATGCTSITYVPVDNPQTQVDTSELQEYIGQVEVDVSQFGMSGLAGDSKVQMQSRMEAEMRSLQGAGNNDFKLVYRADASDRSRSSFNIILYLVTLGIMPGWGEDVGDSYLELYDKDGEMLYRSNQQWTNKTTLTALSPFGLLGGLGRPSNGDGVFLDFGSSEPASLPMHRDQLNAHKGQLMQFLAGQYQSYQAYERQDTVEGYRSYLKANPNGLFRKKAIRSLIAKAPAKGALPFHISNAEIAADYPAYLPQDTRFWFSGPAGMKVYQVREQAKRSSAAILEARIRSGAREYSRFSDREIDIMIASGIPDGVVAAMIEKASTAAPVVAAPAPAAPSTVPVSAAALQPAVATAVPTTANTAAPEQGNVVTDTAEECAKRFAALKACDQLPFGGSMCRTGVNRKYSSIVCPLLD